MAMAGVRPGMVVHNAYGYGLFTGGLGFHQGAERLGALTIPVSGGVTARQALLLRDLQGQVLCCTPSYALHIAQGLREAGIGVDELALEIGMFGAEPWTDAMRDQLEAELGLTALNVYGLSEIVGPGVSAECPEARDGLHVQEDHFLVEVVDPETGEPVPDGDRRRARVHDADQGGDAAAALPHRRHRVTDPRAVRVRADVRADERGPRPPRRHADRARREPLPVADRARAAARRRASRRTTSWSSSGPRPSTRSPCSASRPGPPRASPSASHGAIRERDRRRRRPSRCSNPAPSPAARGRRSGSSISVSFDRLERRALGA